MSRVLVVGASGYVGSHLVPRLVAAGHTVRAAGRNADVLRGRAWPGVEVAEVDVTRRETLAPALRGIETAYYLVHSLASGRGFAALDRAGAENFAEAAASAGVRRIVYLGGLQPMTTASPHLASRRETGDALRRGPTPVIELRAGIIVGPGSAAFEVIRDLANHLPVMLTPRWVRSRSQPIALRDVVEYLARVPEVAGDVDRIFDVGGPEVLSYEEMLRQYGAVAGKRVRIVRLPVLTPRLSSYWLDLVTSVPASVARPLVDGLKQDLLAGDRPIRALLPIPLLTFREAVADALAMERTEAMPARWTEGGLAFRGRRQDNSYYAVGMSASAEAGAPAKALWREVSGIGGRRGWYYLDILWRIRGAVDRAAGGVGMRRGRRDPDSLRAGDALDFWRVVSIDPPRRLTLLAEMRLPGSAVLEFEVESLGPTRSKVTVTARFHPAGAPGLLYWHSLWPAHRLIFTGLPRRLATAAERRWLREGQAAAAEQAAGGTRPGA